MKMKKDNNLILVNVGDKKYYFTSSNGAGKMLNMQGNSINWAIIHKNILYNNEGEEITIELVDGTEIPYKYINNYPDE